MEKVPFKHVQVGSRFRLEIRQDLVENCAEFQNNYVRTEADLGMWYTIKS